MKSKSNDIANEPWLTADYHSQIDAIRALCASTVSIWFCRVDMLELTTSILGGKPPVYG